MVINGTNPGLGLFFHIIIATLVVKINDSSCFLVENSI
jgi:hypothetical protein